MATEIKPESAGRSPGGAGPARCDREQFAKLPRRPITALLDGVAQNYNVGAVFRLCDAFLVEKLIIAGVQVNLRKRRLVQAAQGAEYWVPWQAAESAVLAAKAVKAAGGQLIVVHPTAGGVRPEQLNTAFPVAIVLGNEGRGISPEIIDIADSVVTIPMLGMANSLNVATAAAIVLYELSRLLEKNATVAS